MNERRKTLESLSTEEKRRLLAQALKKKMNEKKLLPAIVRQPMENPPLSFSQQRIWLLDQLAPEGRIFTIPTSLMLQGTLDIRALELSLGEIIRRHEILRTTFALRKEQLVQVIAPFQEVKIPVIDLRPLSQAEKAIETQRLVDAEALSPFDLAQGPLLRMTLLYRDIQEYVLLLTVHHVVFDGWSKGVFIHELVTLYSSYVEGKPSPLPELPIQYSDFALWQRQWLQEDALESQLAYWKQKLHGTPTLLQLPTDHPRPAALSFKGTRQSFVLDPDLTRELKQMSQREGVTLFMLLLAVFQVFLSHYSGQEDIVVGSPIANRTQVVLENLIGCFINTLALRTVLSGNPTMRDLLQRVRETALGAYAHQDLPFERLVEELRPGRSLSYNPLFQVMFVLQNSPQVPLTLPNVTFKPIGIETDVKGFDITLFMAETEQGLAGDLDYNTDLFAASTIQRMIAHFQMLLKAIVLQPEQRLSDLPLTTEIERKQVLEIWNDTQRPYEKNLCLYEIFERQVAYAPDAVALVQRDRQITYQELNQRANQLAHHLQKQGVHPGMLVGLCMQRSLEMVIGILSILKVGAAYVPLDPTYPDERLTAMLDYIQIVVTLAPFKPKFPSGVQLVCCDTQWTAIATEDIANMSRKTRGNNLFYVIYTSGSTGKPKGAGVHQHGFLNLLHWYISEFAITSQDSTLFFTSLSFDLSQKNIFAPLITGGRLYLLDSEHYEPDLIAQTVSEASISLLNCTPSAFYPLIECADQQAFSKLSSLKYLFLGGEAIVAQRLWPWLASSHCHAEVVNTYGPTECTDIAAFHRLTKPSQVLNHPVPVGKPIANMRLFVLDSYLRPVPIGVAGELYIAGEGVGIGYINDAPLTATKFLASPFSDTPGAYLYKTGDQVCYRQDGAVEFLGRIDTQVKLRGFRIELEEIETVLSAHPAIQRCAVVIHQDEQKAEFLSAYLITASEAIITANELRNYLKERLPNYMIPTSFTLLDTLPLSPNGKVDRQALRKYEAQQIVQEETFVAPRDPLEESLARIWAQVLGLERVSIHSDFFALGGHSLLAVQLIAEISVHLNQDISIKSLFLYPDIASLANAIRQQLPVDTMASPTDKEPTTPHLYFFPFAPFAHCHPQILLEEGHISRIDAASLGYLPDELLQPTGTSHDTLLHNWCQNLPLLASVIETPLGRVALLALPRFRSDLYRDQQDLVAVTLKTLAIAGQLGARVVSLGGLIPSATDYGQSLVKAMAGSPVLPPVSTGHATTTAAVVLTIKKILELSGRKLSHERVAFLGLGSIGRASLDLMLSCLPHPKDLILCDVYSNLKHLEAIRLDLFDRIRFQGKLRVLAPQRELPPELYDATLIVAATNVPDILDVSCIQPGSIIVDDSSPHCFSSQLATQRLLEQQDILFTEGGILQAPEPMERIHYMLHETEQGQRTNHLIAISKQEELTITGCVLSSLLSSSLKDLPPTVGLVNVSTCLQHYQALLTAGYVAADPRCEDYIIPPDLIQAFRRRFGNQSG